MMVYITYAIIHSNQDPEKIDHEYFSLYSRASGCELNGCAIDRVMPA